MSILLIALLTSGIAQGTNLYTENGQLRIDTTYKIDPSYLKVIKEIERSLHSVYRDIEYPYLAAENGISGTIIAKIHVNNSRLSIWCEIVKYTDPIFKKPVTNSIHKNALSLLRCTKESDDFEFYLPFKFDVTLVPLIKDMKNEKAIRIKTHFLAPVSAAR